MYYGELKDKGFEYSTGHHIGSIRAFDWAINDFEHYEDDYMTKQEVLDFLRYSKARWIEYEMKFGHGESEK